jgi:hypothetical protein
MEVSASQWASPDSTQQDLEPFTSTTIEVYAPHLDSTVVGRPRFICGVQQWLFSEHFLPCQPDPFLSLWLWIESLLSLRLFNLYLLAFSDCWYLWLQTSDMRTERKPRKLIHLMSFEVRGP